MQDIRDVLEGLRRTPKVLSEFVKAIAEDKMDMRRGKGFRTIAEHANPLTLTNWPPPSPTLKGRSACKLPPTP